MALELITEAGIGNALYKTISKARDTYDYIMGNRDSRFNYKEKATKKELKQTPFGAYMKGNFTMPKSAEAMFDRDNKMLRLTFRASDVGNGQTLVGGLDPKNKDKKGSLYKYVTSYKDGIITLEMPMDGEIEDRLFKNNTSDKLRSDSRFDDTNNESMMTPVQVPADRRSLICDKEGHLILKEDAEDSDESYYSEIDVKTVYDEDGFTTDYTLYYDETNDKYICIFGDQEIYNPSNTEPDAEFDTEEEAMEWFENYEGIDTSSEYDDDEDPLYNSDEPDDYYDSFDEPIKEDYWFGGDGKIDIPNRSNNSNDKEDIMKDMKDILNKEDDEEKDANVQGKDKDNQVEEATQVGNIGQHKMSAIDLVPETEKESCNVYYQEIDPKTRKAQYKTKTFDNYDNLDRWVDKHADDSNIEITGHEDLDETMNLNLSSPNVTYTGPDDYEGTLEIEINGKKYKYKLNPGTNMTTQELADKVAKMQKYSDGKALAYLKKNTHVVNESKEVVKEGITVWSSSEHAPGRYDWRYNHGAKDDYNHSPEYYDRNNFSDEYYGYLTVEHPVLGDFYISAGIDGDIRIDGKPWNFLQKSKYKLTQDQIDWVNSHKDELSNFAKTFNPKTEINESVMSPFGDRLIRIPFEYALDHFENGRDFDLSDFENKEDYYKYLSYIEDKDTFYDEYADELDPSSESIAEGLQLKESSREDIVQTIYREIKDAYPNVDINVETRESPSGLSVDFDFDNYPGQYDTQLTTETDDWIRFLNSLRKIYLGDDRGQRSAEIMYFSIARPDPDDIEAYNAINAHEAEYGADGTRVFREGFMHKTDDGIFYDQSKVEEVIERILAEINPEEETSIEDLDSDTWNKIFKKLRYVEGYTQSEVISILKDMHWIDDSFSLDSVKTEGLELKEATEFDSNDYSTPGNYTYEGHDLLVTRKDFPKDDGAFDMTYQIKGSPFEILYSYYGRGLGKSLFKVSLVGKGGWGMTRQTRSIFTALDWVISHHNPNDIYESKQFKNGSEGLQLKEASPKWYKSLDRIEGDLREGIESENLGLIEEVLSSMDKGQYFILGAFSGRVKDREHYRLTVTSIDTDLFEILRSYTGYEKLNTRMNLEETAKEVLNFGIVISGRVKNYTVNIYRDEDEQEDDAVKGEDGMVSEGLQLKEAPDAYGLYTDDEIDAKYNDQASQEKSATANYRDQIRRLSQDIKEDYKSDVAEMVSYFKASDLGDYGEDEWFSELTNGKSLLRVYGAVDEDSVRISFNSPIHGRWHIRFSLDGNVEVTGSPAYNHSGTFDEYSDRVKALKIFDQYFNDLKRKYYKDIDGHLVLEGLQLKIPGTQLDEAVTVPEDKLDESLYDIDGWVDKDSKEYKDIVKEAEALLSFVTEKQPKLSIAKDCCKKILSILDESKALKEDFHVGDHVQWSDNKGTSRDGIIRSFTLTNQDGKQVSAAVINGKEVPINKLEIVSTEVSESLSDNDIKVIKIINKVYKDLGTLDSEEALTNIEGEVIKQGISIDDDHLGDLIAKSKDMINQLNESIADDVVKSQDKKEMTRKAIKLLKNVGGEYKDLAQEFKDAYGEDVWDDEKLDENKQVKEKVSFKDHHICQGCGKPLSQCTCQVKEEE